MKHIRLSKLETETVIGVLEGDASDPVALIASVGLDPKAFFEYGDWRGVDFRKSNIDLASFVGADLSEAIFDPSQAIIVEHRFGFPRSRMRILQSSQPLSSARSGSPLHSTSNIDMRLIGPFRLLSKEGEDLTPRSSKARALLALLATSPGYQRPRKWLQDKLWSDRGEQQGAASLRQALAEIRRTLGSYASVIQADRSTVSIKSDDVTVDINDPNPEVVSRTYEESELLEGLDVKDPEFEDWLRGIRMKFEADHPSDDKPAESKGDIKTEKLTSPVNVPVNTCSLVFSLRNSTLAKQLAQDKEKVPPFVSHVVTSAQEIVFSHGGFFDMVKGDGIVAHFCDPTELELPANLLSPQERALHAAAEIIQTTSRICEEFQLELVHWVNGFGAAVGLHVGQEIWSIRDRTVHIDGESVTIADRLCAAAEVNNVLISNSFFRDLSGQASSETALKFVRREFSMKDGEHTPEVSGFGWDVMEETS